MFYTHQSDQFCDRRSTIAIRYFEAMGPEILAIRLCMLANLFNKEITNNCTIDRRSIAYFEAMDPERITVWVLE